MLQSFPFQERLEDYNIKKLPMSYNYFMSEGIEMVRDKWGGLAFKINEKLEPVVYDIEQADLLTGLSLKQRISLQADYQTRISDLRRDVDSADREGHNNAGRGIREAISSLSAELQQIEVDIMDEISGIAMVENYPGIALEMMAKDRPIIASGNLESRQYLEAEGVFPSLFRNQVYIKTGDRWIGPDQKTFKISDTSPYRTTVVISEAKIDMGTRRIEQTEKAIWFFDKLLPTVEKKAKEAGFVLPTTTLNSVAPLFR